MVREQLFPGLKATRLSWDKYRLYATRGWRMRWRRSETRELTKAHRKRVDHQDTSSGYVETLERG